MVEDSPEAPSPLAERAARAVAARDAANDRLYSIQDERSREESGKTRAFEAALYAEMEAKYGERLKQARAAVSEASKEADMAIEAAARAAPREIPICPECGYEHRDPWEYKEGTHEIECLNCGSPLMLRVEVSVGYTLSKRELKPEVKP